MDGEEDNFGGRCDLAYLVCSLDAIHDRHIDVEEDEVRMQLSDLLDSLLAIFSFAANVHGVPVQKRADRLPRYLIIVHDQNPDWHLRFPVPSEIERPADRAGRACQAGVSRRNLVQETMPRHSRQYRYPLKSLNNSMDGNGPAVVLTQNCQRRE